MGHAPITFYSQAILLHRSEMRAACKKDDILPGRGKRCAKGSAYAAGA
jgi:hypothetical protein